MAYISAMAQHVPPDPTDDALPDQAIKGRGAVSNRVSRYFKEERARTTDGWDTPDDEDLPPLRTTVMRDATRTIIARNESPDIGFDRSINPYRGCEHGCIYCFARPTHAYLGLSPGLDFETKLLMKPDAAKLLEQELRKPGYQPAVIAMGTNTDPYQPIEREHRITRGILEVLRDFNHPVGIVTKSALIQRDIDILAPMAEKRLAHAFVSITTLDRELARKMEPRAATPPRRLETIRALAAAGIPVGVMSAPMIPALNDHEMENILEAAAAVGATAAGYTALRLPLEIKDLFTEWLEAHAPGRAQHVLELVRTMRGGELYDSSWGERMRGTGPYAELLRRRFQVARKRLGLDRASARWNFDLTLFKPPPRAGDQLTLL
ncbi:MAG TPA: PA0069 family radical SAM protein [Candidatus Acidoferrum sp.]|nr:PA0069 family radical SAM protein [Candidatus Acidoferrum sp.]